MGEHYCTNAHDQVNDLFCLLLLLIFGILMMTRPWWCDDGVDENDKDCTLGGELNQNGGFFSQSPS